MATTDPKVIKLQLVVDEPSFRKLKQIMAETTSEVRKLVEALNQAGTALGKTAPGAVPFVTGSAKGGTNGAAGGLNAVGTTVTTKVTATSGNIAKVIADNKNLLKSISSESKEAMKAMADSVRESVTKQASEVERLRNSLKQLNNEIKAAKKDAAGGDFYGNAAALRLPELEARRAEAAKALFGGERTLGDLRGGQAALDTASAGKVEQFLTGIMGKLGPMGMAAGAATLAYKGVDTLFSFGQEQAKTRAGLAYSMPLEANREGAAWGNTFGRMGASMREGGELPLRYFKHRIEEGADPKSEYHQEWQELQKLRAIKSVGVDDLKAGAIENTKKSAKVGAWELAKASMLGTLVGGPIGALGLAAFNTNQKLGEMQQDVNQDIRQAGGMDVYGEGSTGIPGVVKAAFNIFGKPNQTKQASLGLAAQQKANELNLQQAQAEDELARTAGEKRVQKSQDIDWYANNRRAMGAAQLAWGTRDPYRAQDFEASAVHQGITGAELVGMRNSIAASGGRAAGWNFMHQAVSAQYGGLLNAPGLFGGAAQIMGGPGFGGAGSWMNSLMGMAGRGKGGIDETAVSTYGQLIQQQAMNGNSLTSGLGLMGALQMFAQGSNGGQDVYRANTMAQGLAEYNKSLGGGTDNLQKGINTVAANAAGGNLSVYARRTLAEKMDARTISDILVNGEVPEEFRNLGIDKSTVQKYAKERDKYALSRYVSGTGKGDKVDDFVKAVRGSGSDALSYIKNNARNKKEQQQMLQLLGTVYSVTGETNDYVSGVRRAEAEFGSEYGEKVKKHGGIGASVTGAAATDNAQDAEEIQRRATYLRSIDGTLSKEAARRQAEAEVYQAKGGGGIVPAAQAAAQALTALARALANGVPGGGPPGRETATPKKP